MLNSATAVNVLLHGLHHSVSGTVISPGIASLSTVTTNVSPASRPEKSPCSIGSPSSANVMFQSPSGSSPMSSSSMETSVNRTVPLLCTLSSKPIVSPGTTGDSSGSLVNVKLATQSSCVVTGSL